MNLSMGCDHGGYALKEQLKTYLEAVYARRGGLCLETQYFPDSANKPAFPSCIFGGEKEYDSVTVYRFDVD